MPRPSTRVRPAPLGPDDFQDWRRLQAAAYGELWRREDYDFLREQLRGVFADGRLAAGLRLWPFGIFFGERVVAGAGIGSVATSAEFRRQGYATGLLRSTLEDLRESGRVLATLYPFSYAFYRRLGWQQVADTVSYAIPLADLPRSDRPEEGAAAPRGRAVLVSSCAPGETPRIEEGAIVLLDRAYRTYARRYCGLVERGEEHWRRHLLTPRDAPRMAALWLDETGEPGGYVIYQLPVFYPMPQDIRVRELVAVDDAAYRGLLGYLRNHEGLYGKVRLHLAPGEPLLHYLPDPRVERELTAHFMARLVDLPRALEATADPLPGTRGSLALTVTDPFCPWNDGAWKVEVEGGGVSVTRVGGGAPGGPVAEARTDVGTLAQIVFGFCRAGTAKAVGRLETSSDEAVTLLDSVWGHRPARLADSF
ncbi:MAG: GNAT family N-acetyltransferase [Firmicutes bacterium]|nr:GNAT family N-acetyltransferase [Bacillota bacterium]